MERFLLRQAERADFDKVLELNEKAVQYTSPMDLQLLESLAELSELFRVVVADEKVIAFVLALCEGTDYKSINYNWFLKNYQHFLYIDRVVVSDEYKSCGIGSLLYDDVLKHGRQIKTEVVAAEINVEPPNPPSLKFHEKFGFQEVGQLSSQEGKKRVSLQVWPVE